MSESSKKSKSPVILFGLGFVVVVFVTLIVNWRSAFVRSVSFPLNDGVAYLSTLTDRLAAVCRDNKVYVWDWRQLSGKPKIVNVRSDQAALLESGHVISVRRSDAQAVAVTNLDSDNVIMEMPIYAGNKRLHLGANRSGQTVVVAIEEKNGSYQEVVLVDCNAGLVRPIVELADAAEDRIMGMAVSDDGGLVVLVGEKDGQGYVALVNVEQKLVAWAERLPDLQKVRNAVFSTDGKIIYIRGTDSTVQVIDTETGKVLKRLLPVSENKSTAGDQNVQTLTTSGDGRFIAASISGIVYVWDCKTEKVIFSKGPGHKLVSGLAFSPDSKFLATSDSRQGGVIKIWRIPRR